MKKTYEKTLPEGYREALVIDAGKISLGIILNIIAAVIMISTAAISYFIIKPDDFFENYGIIKNLIFVLSIFLYMVLHELVHGIAYKSLTREKLKFGLTLTVAYCGVPHIFTYRKTALTALLSPFVVFSVIFLLLTFILPNEWDKFYSSLLFALHFGGCVGDLYVTFLYLFKFKSPDTLMQDTGPKQTFYIKN